MKQKLLSKSNASWKHLTELSKPEKISKGTKDKMHDAAVSANEKIEFYTKVNNDIISKMEKVRILKK